MLDRIVQGDVPSKHHVALRSPTGDLRHEECLTREGFDGPYTILYHEHPPHALSAAPPRYNARAAAPDPRASEPLRRRHLRTSILPLGGAPLDSRFPLLVSDDLAVSVVRATASDPVYFSNGDADELYFVRAGSGVLRSLFGDLPFAAGDYVAVPKGVLYRLVLDAEAFDALLVELHGGLSIPEQHRNAVGQLRMDAPYCHRDFRRPTFRGPLDEGILERVTKRAGAYHGHRSEAPPLDVVGWDGAVYPWAFPILAFQPRVGSVHLPPTWHGTFAARGALVCSFVPRPLDFHPDAVPCPYPHSSTDVDEVIFYVSGDFSSRTGIEPGSITLHPRGIPHGPHPGRYEASPGARATTEVAVMLDCHAPLALTADAARIDDETYDESWTPRTDRAP